MVTLNDENHFYVRRVREVLKMTVDELRKKFLFADSGHRRMSAFRKERTSQLSDQLESVTCWQAHYLFHFLPLRSFNQQPNLEMSGLFNDTTTLSPNGGQYEWSPHYNFHGIQVVERVDEKQFRKTQIFRNGSIEIVGGYMVNNDQGQPTLLAHQVEKLIHNRTAYALRLIEKLNIQPPIFVGLSLIRVNGLFLKTGVDESAGPLTWRDLVFDEVLLDALNPDLQHALYPLMDIMAQSFGVWQWPRAGGR